MELKTAAVDKAVEEAREIVKERWNPIIITGGKEEPPENWLGNLPATSAFLCMPRETLTMPEQEKKNLRGLASRAEFHIVAQTPGGHTWLLPDGRKPNPGEPKYWVDSLIFSRQYTCKEVLYDPRDHQERASSDLVSDEAVEGSQQLLPSE